jgi:hypothetical protein
METTETWRAVYDAIVDYHNNLVHMRFTVAGLYIAATGFLANSWFGDQRQPQAILSIPILGITLTLICLLLEKRTTQLLENLDERGLRIERRKRVGSRIGFFALMKEQELEASLPFIRPRRHEPSRAQRLEPPTRLQRALLRVRHYFISHTFGLDMLYVSILAFWISMWCLR